jgi:hypothetical protein
VSAVVVHRAGNVVVVVAPPAAWQELAEIGLDAGRRRSADGRPLRSVTAELLSRLRALGPSGSDSADPDEGEQWLSGGEASRLLGGLTLARLRQLRERGGLVAVKRGGCWWYAHRSVLVEVARRGLAVQETG